VFLTGKSLYVDGVGTSFDTGKLSWSVQRIFSVVQYLQVREELIHLTYIGVLHFIFRCLSIKIKLKPFKTFFIGALLHNKLESLSMPNIFNLQVRLHLSKAIP